MLSFSIFWVSWKPDVMTNCLSPNVLNLDAEFSRSPRKCTYTFYFINHCCDSASPRMCLKWLRPPLTHHHIHPRILGHCPSLRLGAFLFPGDSSLLCSGSSRVQTTSHSLRTLFITSLNRSRHFPTWKGFIWPLCLSRRSSYFSTFSSCQIP